MENGSPTWYLISTHQLTRFIHEFNFMQIQGMTERNHSSAVIKGRKWTFGEGTEGSVLRMTEKSLVADKTKDRKSIFVDGTVSSCEQLSFLIFPDSIVVNPHSVKEPKVPS